MKLITLCIIIIVIVSAAMVTLYSLRTRSASASADRHRPLQRPAASAQLKAGSTQTSRLTSASVHRTTLPLLRFAAVDVDRADQPFDLNRARADADRQALRAQYGHSARLRVTLQLTEPEAVLIVRLASFEDMPHSVRVEFISVFFFFFYIFIVIRLTSISNILLLFTILFV